MTSSRHPPRAFPSTRIGRAVARDPCASTDAPYSADDTHRAHVEPRRVRRPRHVDGLGPHLGALPSDVLRRCLLSRLSALSIAMFARASGACWRATKDARLATSLDVRSCEFAAQGGHLALLRYLREIGCPWDESTWRDATRWGGTTRACRISANTGARGGRRRATTRTRTRTRTRSDSRRRLAGARFDA